jgi:tetratricopeptide (TPR) repeat protein
MHLVETQNFASYRRNCIPSSNFQIAEFSKQYLPYLYDMKRSLVILLLQVVFASALFAQKGRDETLAASYFQNGEYDKAIELYQTLWEKNNYAPQFYAPLYKSYMELKKYDEAEKVVKKQIKKFDQVSQYQIDLGYLYRAEGNISKSKEVYDKVVKNIRPSEAEIRQTAIEFKNYRENDYEIAVYEKGEKIFKGNVIFAYDVATAYFAKGDNVNAAKFYIEDIDKQPENAQQIKNVLQTVRGADKLLAEIETQLYGKIQKSPDNDSYVDFLTWIYIQNKDFEGAIVQMKALDKRKGENGYRVLVIARIAQTEGFYDEAIKGFDYVAKKEPKSGLYFEAKTELLNCRKEKIAKTINYTQDDLLGLKSDYISFIAENGKTPQTATSIKELADLEGFYLHDVDAAIANCEEVINMPGIPVKLKNQTKLSLGDFYLITGEVWESTLLYSQVDKDEKDSPLGEEARFRNAKLSYYKGDFDWAQEQLKVLKASTSELISNDAINLSVFIIDNLGMDTDARAMSMFATSELLLFQNKEDDADKKLDSIITMFPGHALYDDIEYAKAQIFVKKREFAKAVPLLEDIIKNYGKDLKGDDATFMLAEINEKELHNLDRAKELYKSIITDYNSSLLVIEARKRYRALRGDKLEE